MPNELFSKIIGLITLPAYTFIGAFTLYILNRMQDQQPFSLFTALGIDLSTKKAKPHTILYDMIISSVIGAFVVIPLTHPTTVPQALISGLGMTGILSVNSKDTKK